MKFRLNTNPTFSLVAKLKLTSTHSYTSYTIALDVLEVLFKVFKSIYNYSKLFKMIRVKTF
jgi:hypothetical protein